MERLVLDGEGVARLIPHCGDALFVKEAWLSKLAQSDGSTVGGGRASWANTHPVLRGHFPGFALVPGIFLVEAAAQLGGAILMAGNPSPENDSVLGVLSGIRKVLIHRPVFPGDDVNYDLKIKSQGANFFVVSGVAHTHRGKVVTYEFIIGVASRSALDQVREGMEHEVV